MANNSQVSLSKPVTINRKKKKKKKKTAVTLMPKRQEEFVLLIFLVGKFSNCILDIEVLQMYLGYCSPK